MTQKNKMCVILFIAITLLIASYLIRSQILNNTQGSAENQKVETGARCLLLRIVDGDTIHVSCAGKRESVRMLRINTPERDQRGYEEATQALVALLGQGEVRLVSEHTDKIERDRFGRRLAYVFKDGKNANLAIVRQGWSKYWTKYGEGRFKTAFEAAEKEARRLQVGLWSR